MSTSGMRVPERETNDKQHIAKASLLVLVLE